MMRGEWRMRELYLIPDRSNIEESLRLAAEYGTYFEYNDFFLPAVLDDEAKVKELISFYQELPRDRSHDTLHGAFLDVTIHSEDARIREISEQRVRQSIEIAKELGVRGVVFHTNTIPNFKTDTYMQHWLQSNESFWKQMLSEYRNIEIFVENMFDEDPELLAALAEHMKEEPRFGVCLDYAHAMVFGEPEQIGEWMAKLLPYTHHIHINDNDLKADLHQAVGEGRIDWQQFKRFTDEYRTDCSLLIETRDCNKQKNSLEFMKKHGIWNKAVCE